MNPPSSTRQLSTAAERREALIEAAVATFAEHGFYGTPTTEVAKAAGISQAYLFRLFPTKSELYVAAVERCFQRTGDVMRAAAEDTSAVGEDALGRMGRAYALLLVQDSTMLRAMLHALAAGSGDDVAIREAVRHGYGELVELIKRISGADADELRAFVARGMLAMVLAGMDAPSIDKPWARELCGARPGTGSIASVAVETSASR